jgi:ABC-type phosphate/phosphonate transport system ATPase subunit
MDVTLIGLENAGKTSLLRVLSVRICKLYRDFIFRPIANMSSIQGGEFTIE